MRFFKRLSLTLLLLLSVVSVYAGGIKSAADLVAFVTAINSGQDFSAYRNEKGEICLEADIDMAKVKKFASVKAFGGRFDGQGFALKNWKAQSGLFHEILEGGEVCNLRIDASCEMKAQNKGGVYAVGWIADINNGTVRNCENHAPLNHKSTYAENDLYIGGLVGINRYVVISCRNFGAISSNCSGSAAKGQFIRVGGVVGGVTKPIMAATISSCENHGNVLYEGDMPNDRIAGIVGENFKSTVKMCVNRGNVHSSSSLTGGTAAGFSNVGGVSAHGKLDMICCDNFGTITSTGSHGATVGGVYGMPHTNLVVADCTNYGKVEASNDSPVQVGGVVGTIGREVHVINGVNRGEVRFSGFSPASASYIGGVVGQIYTKRDAKTTAYLRRCVNLGLVESQSGSNNYENHNKAIHTGGIVGSAVGNGICKVRMHDCVNKGEVKAMTGRRGNIAGIAELTEVTGDHFDNNIAEAAEPMADGSTIFGRVTDTQGSPVAGCVVSDGEHCVMTDGYGYYAMKSDMADTRFVYISVPDGYKLTHRKSVPQIFRRIPRYYKAAMANFTLEKREKPADEYTVIMIGDPQMRGLGHDGSGERYRDVVLPDIAELKKNVEGKEFFAINLGDLVYNWMDGYDDYLDISALADYPVVEVIGNHDYDQSNLFETRYGTPYFEEYLMPTYYSFNIGKIHYVMVDNIIYDRQTNDGHYRYGLEEKQMKWLEEDLKFVPKDHSIYICGHNQMYKKKGDSPNGSFSLYNQNYERYTALLKEYKRVYSWSGHYHTNFGYSYAGNERFPDLAHFTSIAVARCNGVLRSNEFLSNDGQPNGYMVVEVKDNGEDVKWWFKTVGKDRNYQMRPYTPTRTGDGYVKVNIWNYTRGFWSDIEWWENGTKVGTFEKVEEFDPDYLELHAAKLTHLKGRAGEYAKPAKSDYMFRIKPSEGVRSGEIRVTDNFGVTYSEKIEW